MSPVAIQGGPVLSVVERGGGEGGQRPNVECEGESEQLGRMREDKEGAT